MHWRFLPLWCLLSACAHVMQPTTTSITSNPPDATVFIGYAPDAMLNTHKTTPYVETSNYASAYWDALYFQVKKEGFADSSMIFREQEMGLRELHFDLSIGNSTLRGAPALTTAYHLKPNLFFLKAEIPLTSTTKKPSFIEPTTDTKSINKASIENSILESVLSKPTPESTTLEPKQVEFRYSPKNQPTTQTEIETKQSVYVPKASAMPSYTNSKHTQSHTSGGCHSVRGYYRKGRYVRGHKRCR